MMQTMKKALWVLIIISIVTSIVFFKIILNPESDQKPNDESAPAVDPFVFTLPEPLQNKARWNDFPDWELGNIPVPADFDWKKYSGITLSFIVENNIHANILTKESQKFTEETGIQINIRPMDYNTMLEKISLDLITRRNKYQLIYVDPYQTLNRFHNDLEDLDLYTNRKDLPQIPGGLDDFNPEHTRVLSY
ncbi:MAG: extracellular solute-binding protein, partial [Clostridiaceae bacterium]|nr:extracellular solute-binding protein [Clostridiaceae bacterium]